MSDAQDPRGPPTTKYGPQGLAGGEDVAIGWPECFAVIRDEDDKGRSGTGVVAYGVKFADGKCVWRWTREPRTTKVAESVEDLRELHEKGHATEFVWQSEYEHNGGNQEVPR